MILAMMDPVWELLCILTLVVNVALVVGVIGLVLSLVFVPLRAQPFAFWWGPTGWVGIVVAFIWSFLFYPHCGFLHLPL